MSFKEPKTLTGKALGIGGAIGSVFVAMGYIAKRRLIDGDSNVEASRKAGDIIDKMAYGAADFGDKYHEDVSHVAAHVAKHAIEKKLTGK